MSKTLPPLITLEEHFFGEAIPESFANPYSDLFEAIPSLGNKLHDIDSIRLQSMDQNQISLQIVSHGAGSLTPSQCTQANDQLAKAVRANPDRFAGFAVLPITDPEACATELRRCIQDLHFVGALIDNHTPDGEFFDTKKYDPMFATAESLDVPIYLHPTWPSQAMVSALYYNLSPGAGSSIATWGYGWHSATAVHILRLFASGLFDRYPKLKIVIGHMGEILPFMLQRLILVSPSWGKWTRTFKEVYAENIYITLSGVWSVDPMACILRNTNINHILYSVDYPFARNEEGLKFMEDLKVSGLVNEEQLEKIAFRNAVDLFRLDFKPHKIN